MCMVSNIGDGFNDYFPNKWPNYPHWDQDGPSQVEFDALKKEVEELKKLLQAAKKFDEATGQHDCEMEDKVKFIKKVAEAVGVDLGDVFTPPKKKK